MSDLEDFDTPRRVSVVDMAHEIVSMDYEIRRLRSENAQLREYRQKYDEELRNGIEHGERMMGGLFTLGMKLASTGYFDKRDERSESA